MKRPYNRRIESQETLREKIIGLGEESIHKNYFPELQKRLIELERFRFLVDQSSDIFIVAFADSFIISDFSTSNRICFSNPGHSPLRLDEFFPKETMLQLRKFINNLDQTGVKDKIIESEFRSEDCPTIPVELSVSVIKNNADQWIVLIVRDITERKQNETKIKRQIDRLTTLQKVEHAISSSLELNKVLETLKTELARYMDITDVNVLLYDSLSKQLRRSLEPDPNSIQTEHETLYFANLSIQQRQLIKIDDFSTSNFDIKSIRKKTTISNKYIAVPLIANGEVKGVLELFYKQEPDDSDWESFINTLANQTANAIQNAGLFKKVKQFNYDIQIAYDATLEGWALALELRENETEKHTQRVRDLTTEVVKFFGFSDEDIIHIQRGALLHDIGKMGIPDSILLKPGPLNEDEWQIMRRHPTYAVQMLSKINFLKPALVIPFCHHERWNGSGYPRGLVEKEIPLEARIFAIVDVWDALSSDRIYRKAWKQDDIIEYIQKNAGILFDPEIVKVFLSILSK